MGWTMYTPKIALPTSQLSTVAEWSTTIREKSRRSIGKWDARKKLAM